MHRMLPICIVCIFIVFLSSGCATKKLYSKTYVNHETLANQVYLSHDGASICIPYWTSANTALESSAFQKAEGHFIANIPAQSSSILKAALPFEIRKAEVKHNNIYFDFKEPGKPRSSNHDIKLKIYPSRPGKESLKCDFAGNVAVVSQNDPFILMFDTKEDRYPITLKIVGTPFTVAYDVITAPLLLLYWVVVFYGAAAAQ